MASQSLGFEVSGFNPRQLIKLISLSCRQSRRGHKQILMANNTPAQMIKGPLSRPQLKQTYWAPGSNNVKPLHTLNTMFLELVQTHGLFANKHSHISDIDK